MWQPKSLKSSFDNKSGASTPLTPAIPTRSMARALVYNVSSSPKRKVMAFSSWTLCVLRPHLRVSIRSHFLESTLSNSGSVSILCQSLLSHCNLGCCDLLRNRQRMSSPLHRPYALVFKSLDTRAPNVPSRDRCGNVYVRSVL